MNLAGTRVTVMGLGQFGGGAGVARWLAAQGAEVLVTDLLPPDRLADSLAQLRPLVDAGQITLRLGGHNVSDFTTCDLVVANPAVPRPWDNRYLRAARAAGVPITTEIRLLLDHLPRTQRVIAVTGTAGKSTTAAMIACALAATGQRVHLGGNIGGSLLPVVHTLAPDDWIVLELSSFMLYWLDPSLGRDPPTSPWAPAIAVLTGFSSNHLDWHGDVAHYRESKLNLVRYQPGEAACLYAVPGWPDARGLPRQARGVDASALDRIAAGPVRLRVPGEHNRANAALALAAVHAAVERSGADALPAALVRRAAAALAEFPGLAHRLQLVLKAGGVRVYDDSKSTTPQATLLAVHAFPDPARVHLIAGGYDKGADLRPVADLAPQLGGLYTIGATGPGLAHAARLAGAAHVFDCRTLDDAVARARSRTVPGDVLLLSPACASWDQFVNYQDRGDRFAALVRSAYASAPGTDPPACPKSEAPSSRDVGAASRSVPPCLRGPGP